MQRAIVRADHPSQLRTLQISAALKYRLCLCQSRRGQLRRLLRPGRCGGEHAVVEGAVMDEAAVTEGEAVIGDEMQRDPSAIAHLNVD